MVLGVEQHLCGCRSDKARMSRSVAVYLVVEPWRVMALLRHKCLPCFGALCTWSMLQALSLGASQALLCTGLSAETNRKIEDHHPAQVTPLSPVLCSG